jgi:microcystin-dependent protein
LAAEEAAMADAFVGEIRLFGGNFAPLNWAFCDGRLLLIGEYEALFNLIGTSYGGDGQTTFGLPDLRGRAPIHFGNGQILGQVGGAEEVALTGSQLPTHSHQVNAVSPASETAPSLAPTNAVFGSPTSLQAGTKQYASAPVTVALHPLTIGLDGGLLPHPNVQPYLCVSFIIALFGVFPSQG